MGFFGDRVKKIYSAGPRGACPAQAPAAQLARLRTRMSLEQCEKNRTHSASFQGVCTVPGTNEIRSRFVCDGPNCVRVVCMLCGCYVTVVCLVCAYQYLLVCG